MLADSYISGIELEAIQKKYGNKIICFAAFREKMHVTYRNFGFNYRDASENNFRDSWFHYRKIYQEHSGYELMSQTATLEEHLQRAEKDAIVHFLQKTSELLEFWYLLNKGQRDNILNAQEESQALMVYDNSQSFLTGNWVYMLKSFCGDDFTLFVDMCIYIAEQRLITKDFKRDTQQLLHNMKNAILEIRIGGTEIQRTAMPGDYLAQYDNCLDELDKLCSKYNIKSLICITEEIELHLLNVESELPENFDTQ